MRITEEASSGVLTSTSPPVNPRYTSPVEEERRVRRVGSTDDSKTASEKLNESRLESKSKLKETKRGGAVSG